MGDWIDLPFFVWFHPESLLCDVFSAFKNLDMNRWMRGDQFRFRYGIVVSRTLAIVKTFLWKFDGEGKTHLGEQWEGTS
jgi:hypothetical protein